MNSITDDQLAAFMDGRCTDAEAEAIALALEQDPDLAVRAEALAGDFSEVRAAFDEVLSEPVPEAILAAATPRSNVVSLGDHRPGRPANRPSWFVPAAIAASLCIGVGIGSQVSGPSSAPADPALILTSSGTLAPSAALSDALSTRGSGSDTVLTGGTRVRPTLTFRDHQARLCRQFEVSTDKAATEALACRDGDQWNVMVTARTETRSAGFETASGPGDSPVARTVDQMIAAEAMDATQEAKALAELPRN